MTKTRPVSLAEEITNSTLPPKNIKILRRATEAVAPMTVCIKVVSAVSRERTSPVRMVSKNAGLKPMIWLYTAVRISAMMRSPNQVTR